MPDPRDRSSASALYWFAALVLSLLFISLVTGALAIPGVPVPQVSLDAAKPWLLILVTFLGTKLLLEVFKPLFRSGLRKRVPSEADIFALYQMFTYVAWVGAIGFAVYIFFGGNLAEIGVLGGAVVLGVLIYVLQEPLLNLVGWAILVVRRIYKLGDRIEVNGTKGYVVSISPMNTTLREFGGWLTGELFTGRYVTVPNKSVLSSNVFSYTKDTPFIWTEVTAAVTYDSNLRRAEELILEAADEVVGELMRENRELIRQKYEFRDLASLVVEEPLVRWHMRDSWVEFSLVFFCPAHRRGYYTSEVTKRILEKFSADSSVDIAYPHLELSPSSQRPFKVENTSQ